VSLETSIRSYFGGATIKVEVSRASPETPVDTSVAANLQRFLSVMQKAWKQGKDLQFSLCLQAFAEEVDAHLDDERMGARENTPEFAPGGSTVARLIEKRRAQLGRKKRRGGK